MRQGSHHATVPGVQRGNGARGRGGEPGAWNAGGSGRLGVVLAMLAAGVLGGCGNQRVALDAPVQWWHDLEGGTIAQQRPPPPGIGQPYPKIGTVPARPVLPDVASRTGETDRLAAQREQVERVLTRTPLPPSGSATTQALASEGVAPGGGPAGAAPAGPAGPMAARVVPAAGVAAPTAQAAGPAAGAVAAPAPAPGSAVAGDVALAPAAGDPNLASATLAAAVAPPAPAPAPLKIRSSGPSVPVERATPQELAVLQGSAPAPGAPLVVAGQAADAGVVLPPLAGEPPPPPSFETATADPQAPLVRGASPPAAALASRAPLSRATPQEPLSRRGTPVRFQPGSASLLPDQAGVLRALAGRRGAAPVAVTGYGDAGADTPDAQSEALSLGLQRAQAMSAVLGTYGVPAGAIRIAAEAFGRGGTVRLIH